MKVIGFLLHTMVLRLRNHLTGEPGVSPCIWLNYRYAGISGLPA